MSRRRRSPTDAEVRAPSGIALAAACTEKMYVMREGMGGFCAMGRVRRWADAVRPARSAIGESASLQSPGSLGN